MVVPNFWLTQLGVVFVISHPYWPAFVFLSPIESPFGNNFHWERIFFKGSWENGVIRNWSVRGVIYER